MSPAVRLMLVGAAALLGAAAQPADDLAGRWYGTVRIEEGMRLRLIVDLRRTPGGWTGSLDAPDQGTFGLRLAAVEVAPPLVRFAVVGPAGSPAFEGVPDDAGERLVGTYRQGPEEHPCVFERAPSPPLRPQDPQPPLPYHSEDVTFASAASDREVLAGTVTAPRGPGPHPGVVLVGGSFAQDRDGTVVAHRPLRLLADRLTRSGFAVLRWDDRGVGGSGGVANRATSQVQAADVVGAVRWLRRDPRIGDQPIGALGHSEGVTVAARAAAAERLAFLVALAGPALPGEPLVLRQLQLTGDAEGLPDALIARQLELRRRMIEALRGGDPRVRRAAVREIVRLQLGLEGAARGDRFEAAVEATVDAVDNPWFRDFLEHDPRVDLAGLGIPVLWLCGAHDLQVDPRQNLPHVVAALRRAGSPDATVHVLPGLNHLLQNAVTGSPLEYGMIEETMAPAALEAIEQWLTRRFVRPGQ